MRCARTRAYRGLQFGYYKSNTCESPTSHACEKSDSHFLDKPASHVSIRSTIVTNLSRGPPNLNSSYRESRVDQLERFELRATVENHIRSLRP